MLGSEESHVLGCDTRLLQPFRPSSLSKFGSVKMVLLFAGSRSGSSGAERGQWRK